LGYLSRTKTNVKGAIMKQLNINPVMDKLARDNSLGHWSCTAPIYAQSWLRSDGEVIVNYNWRPFCETDGEYYLQAFEKLKFFDIHKPMGKDWKYPTTNLQQPTLVQKPFKYPCDGALYFTKTHRSQVKVAVFFGSNDKRVTGVIYGIDSNSFWCAETGKAVNPFGNTVISNDLIMFVWE
jgi:hypothetical protein